MIKIGDFSKLAHVSIKTLHHYGDRGLLIPAHIDRYTGYRFYTLDQLPLLNRIIALKELGFSLYQVVQLLDENLSIDEMRGMLRMKQIELQSEIDEGEARLARVAQRLSQLESGEIPPRCDIVIKEIPAQTVISGQIVAAGESALTQARTSLFTFMKNQLEKKKIKTVGPWFSIIDIVPYDETNLEVVLAVEVNAKDRNTIGELRDSPIVMRNLSCVPKMAAVIHQGGLPTILHSYTSMYKWTQSNGFEVVGPCREVYLPDSAIHTKPDLFDTGFIEVQCPIDRKRIPVNLISPTNGKEKEMEPKIINKPAFKAVGVSYIGKNEAGEIPQTWGVFNRRHKEIKSCDNSCVYGLCFTSPIHQDDSVKDVQGVFEYVAASEVESDSDIPDGMVFCEVPAHKYAVFTHHGKLDKLGETYQYIYDTGLAQSGLEVHPDKFDMEVYDERWITDSDKSAFDIYVAVK